MCFFFCEVSKGEGGVVFLDLLIYSYIFWGGVDLGEGKGGPGKGLRCFL